MSKKPVGKNSKTIHKKPSISKKTRRKVLVPISGTARKVVSIGVIVCAMVVLISLIVNIYYQPDKVATRELEEIARDYYENYFYDNFVAAIPADSSLEKEMGEYAETGFLPVYLRHLLLYNNGKNEAKKRYFETSTYVCDKNATFVRIYPVAPFGRKDYTINYSFACNYK
ncbi:hypothetical protein IJI02_01220 [Candidatus Saccharibacteria bacterium]|nr:hypothetical protein [Candidatus Saccharibacteria bacterium]